MSKEPPQDQPDASFPILPGVRPEGVARNALDIFEEFFGYELSDDMLAALDRLPTEQLAELWERLRDNQVAMWDVLARRKLRGLGAQTLTTFGVTPEQRQPYAYLRGHEITMNDTEQSNPLDIASRGILKHAVLYSEQTIAGDPFGLLMPSTDTAGLKDGLRQLMDVADLIRSGSLVLCPVSTHADPANRVHWNLHDPITRRHVEWVRQFRPGGEFPNIETYFEWLVEAVSFNHWEKGLQDPYIAKIITDAGLDIYADVRQEKMRTGTWTAQQAQAINRGFAQKILERYVNPYGITADELLRIRDLMVNLKLMRLSPIVTSRAVAYHLEQCARVWLEGEPQTDTTLLRPVPTSQAVGYQVPALSEVSFADITMLRQNEDVFHELRQALVTLGEQCAATANSSNQPATLAAYKATVHEYAEGIVRPVLTRIRKLEQRAAFKRLFGTAGIRLATLGLDGVIGPLADVVGGVAERALGHTVRKQQGAKVAGGIIRSILRY